LRNIGQTGGVDAEAISRMRGNGVFDDFAKTGGFSDADIANYRARGISPIGAQYSNDMNAIEQSNRLLGRAAPNFAASVARLNRNRGLGMSDAVRNTETDLQGMIRANKLSGAQNLSDAELAMQDMITGNKLQGLTAAAEGEGNLANAIAGNRIDASNAASTQMQNLQNAINDAKLKGNVAAVDSLTNLAQNIAGNKLTALSGITDTQQGAESIAQQGKIAGAQGMFGVEQADLQAQLAREAQAAAASAASGYNDAISAAQRAEDERWWAQFNAGNEQYIGSAGLEGQLGALGGLGTLYGTAPGAVGQDYQAYLAGLQGRSTGNQQGLQTQQQNVGPGFMQQLTGLLGAGAGAMSAFGGMGGGGGTTTIPSSSAYGGLSPTTGWTNLQGGNPFIQW